MWVLAPCMFIQASAKDLRGVCRQLPVAPFPCVAPSSRIFPLREWPLTTQHQFTAYHSPAGRRTFWVFGSGFSITQYLVGVWHTNGRCTVNVCTITKQISGLSSKNDKATALHGDRQLLSACHGSGYCTSLCLRFLYRESFLPYRVIIGLSINTGRELVAGILITLIN